MNIKFLANFAPFGVKNLTLKQEKITCDICFKKIFYAFF